MSDKPICPKCGAGWLVLNTLGRWWNCNSRVTDAGRFFQSKRCTLDELRQQVARLIAQRDRAWWTIHDIDHALRIPAAEYVPSIGDVFTLIDKLLPDDAAEFAAVVEQKGDSSCGG